MKLLVLGGSPKGETSVTMQYVRWIRENLRGPEIEVIQIASRIGALERDPEAFAGVIEKVRQADALLWAFPLYVFTVCSQYKRFIELIWESGAEEAFRGKYAATLSTSIHFFDHAAHEYMRGVSEDLGMAVTGAFSPKMEELHSPECRRQLLVFAEELVAAAKRGAALPRWSAVLPAREPGLALRASEPAPLAVATPVTGRRALVLVDYPELAIGPMARRAAAVLASEGHQVELLPLQDMGMKGGCLGCLKCGQANHCAYEGKDGFIEAFKTKVMAADLLVYAVTIKNRGLSARWQAFLDRSFFNTHQRVLTGKQFLVLASGPLSLLADLRETVQGYVEWQNGNLVDFVSDELPSGLQSASSAWLDGLVDEAASRSGEALARGAMRPRSFLGVAGMKIFRDDIFGGLKLIFKADHRAYKKEGVYDFPQRKPLMQVAAWFGYWITSIPGVYLRIIRDLPAFMIMQYRPLFARSNQRR